MKTTTLLLAIALGMAGLMTFVPAASAHECGSASGGGYGGYGGGSASGTSDGSSQSGQASGDGSSATDCGPCTPGEYHAHGTASGSGGGGSASGCTSQGSATIPALGFFGFFAALLVAGVASVRRV